LEGGSGDLTARDLLFAVHSEAEAAALVAAGHGDDYQEVRLLAPGAAPVQVRAWSGYIAYRTGKPTIYEELVYEWHAPGPCDDSSQPGGDGHGVYGTDEDAVRAATVAWAVREGLSTDR
jgi:hypothetical protein